MRSVSHFLIVEFENLGKGTILLKHLVKQAPKKFNIVSTDCIDHDLIFSLKFLPAYQQDKLDSHLCKSQINLK